VLLSLIGPTTTLKMEFENGKEYATESEGKQIAGEGEEQISIKEDVN
jgi:hypothetical protein